MHRTDGAAVKYEVMNWALTDTFEHETLTMREFGADFGNAILSGSGRSTRTTSGKGRTLFEQTFENWLENPE